MPIDPAMLAKSIGTLADLDPTRDLAATLQQAVDAAKRLFDADAAGIMLADIDGTLRWATASDQRAQTLEDNQEVFAAGPCMQAFTTGKPAPMHDATLERRWGEITLVFVEVHIRSGLSVPVELGGGPIGTLDVYGSEPRGWDDSEVSALQTYAGVVANLLGAAATAEVKGALADQLQVALDSRAVIERGKGALMEREHLDEQEAFSHLRRAARSSGRRLSEVAREVADACPCPADGPPRPRRRHAPRRPRAMATAPAYLGLADRLAARYRCSRGPGPCRPPLRPGLGSLPSVPQPGPEQLLALLGALAALALGPAEEVGQLAVAVAFGVLDVALQPQGVAQARLGEPDDVVVPVLGPGDLAGLAGAGHLRLLMAILSVGPWRTPPGGA
jgi:hypothetical protein